MGLTQTGSTTRDRLGLRAEGAPNKHFTDSYLIRYFLLLGEGQRLPNGPNGEAEIQQNPKSLCFACLPGAGWVETRTEEGMPRKFHLRRRWRRSYSVVLLAASVTCAFYGAGTDCNEPGIQSKKKRKKRNLVDWFQGNGPPPPPVKLCHSVQFNFSAGQFYHCRIPDMPISSCLPAPLQPFSNHGDPASLRCPQPPLCSPL